MTVATGASGATGDAGVVKAARGVCCGAAVAALAGRAAPDNHTTEPPATTPKANALIVTIVRGLRTTLWPMAERARDSTAAIGSRHDPPGHDGNPVGKRHVRTRQAGKRNFGRRTSRSTDNAERHPAMVAGHRSPPEAQS
jgi:hypothetical protein